MSNKRVSSTKEIFKASFSSVIASGVDVADFNLICTGAGQSVSQSAGNLVLSSGTTANSETIARSRKAFRGNLDLRYGAALSQRIANNNFFVELVDVIGDDLAFSCGSDTAITVRFADGNTNPFYNTTNPDASTVGQSVYLGNIKTSAGNVIIPGRYPISAVDATSVTFTVAGFTSGATGSLSLFGWNYYHILYDGTTATNSKFGVQRNGWAGADTTVTINSTASAGHVGIVTVEDGNVAYQDQSTATTISLQSTNRASRVTTIPDFDTPLFLQIRSVNGTTDPASNTSLTISFVSVEEITVEMVAINGVRPQAFQSALPVNVINAAGPLAASVQGAVVRNNVTPGSPLYIATGLSANPASVTSGRNVDLMATLIGALITKPFSIPESDWQYAASASGIVNTTTAVTFKVAAGAGVRNYITGIDIQWEALTNATEIAIRDGAAGTVIWRGKIPAAAAGNRSIVFQTPLKGTANTLLEVVTLTASGAGAVYFNARGYIAP